MLKHSKRLILVVGLALMMGIIGLLPAQAASNGVLQFPGGDNPDNVCTNGLVSIQSIFTPVTNDFDGLDSVGIALVDGNGKPLGAYLNPGEIGSGDVTF